ncbi:MAG: YceI family protein [Terriglobales bacterium]
MKKAKRLEHSSQIETTIEASPINSREAQRDAHLKSIDFFHVENFPTRIPPREVFWSFVKNAPGSLFWLPPLRQEDCPVRPQNLLP